jgi:methionyl-tRNA formyltransferase
MSIDSAALMVETMRAGFTSATPQIGEPVYARKLTSEDLQLDWTRTASELSGLIRVGNAWTTIAGERFKIHEAEVVDSSVAAGQIQDMVVGTTDGGLRLNIVQPAGKPRMDAAAWANGAQPNGLVLGG